MRDNEHQCRTCLSARACCDTRVMCTFEDACRQCQDPEEPFRPETLRANGGWWINLYYTKKCRYHLPSIEIGPIPPKGGDCA